MAVNLPITNTSYQKPRPAPWVRPSDWPTITDNADQFQALVADTGDATYTISYVLTGTGTTTISWGDGTSINISGTGTSTKTYTPGTGTPCSRGYTTFRIRITKDPGITIGSIRFVGTAATFQSTQTSVGLLEVYYGDNIQTTTSPENFFAGFNSAASILSFMMLEYVKLPVTVSWTTMSNTFINCYNLQKVVMPTSAPNLQALSNTFRNCYELREIVIPLNSTGIISIDNTFASCTNLYSCLLPTSLNVCTSLGGAFSSCRSLESITIPSINLCTQMFNIFNGCLNLLWVRFTSLPSPVNPGTAILTTGILTGCTSLQYVYLPNSCSANAVYDAGSTFTNCYSLRNITFPINFNSSTMANAFQNCYSLYSVVFQSGMPSCTSFNTTFSGCSQLQNIVLPSSMSSSGVTLQSAFSLCSSLISITIPTSYVITNMNTTFGTCSSLRTVVINSAQNSCTTMASAFQSCFSLTSVTMPTSLTTCNSLLLTFQSCFSLTSVTLPSTMNAVTTMQSMFQNCFSLTSVTMPTSVSACTNFSAIFQSCLSLTQITFPATISAATTAFTNAMSGCNNLRVLTLPTTRSTSLNSLNGMLNACGQLTTINNLNLLGSTTATPLVDGTNAGALTLKTTSLSFSCPFTKLDVYGNNSTSIPIALNSLRLTNASAGQWTGASPQINLQFTSLSTAALNTLFADIAAQGNVTSKTINITGTTGTAGLTAADRLVLTSRGWTITG